MDHCGEAHSALEIAFPGVNAILDIVTDVARSKTPTPMLTADTRRLSTTDGFAFCATHLSPSCKYNRVGFKVYVQSDQRTFCDYGRYHDCLTYKQTKIIAR